MESDDDKTQTHIVLTKGTEVGHYRIIEKIGAGGMGEVYLAEDTTLERQVALKFLPSHLCQDDDCRERFKREAQATAKLDHLFLVFSYVVGLMHYEGHQFEHAMNQFKSGLDREPTFQLALLWLTHTYCSQGDFDNALTVTRQLESLPGGKKFLAGMLGTIYARQGMVDKAESELKRLTIRAEKEYIPYTRFVPMLFSLGRKDEAFEYLEKAYQERDGYLSRITISPFFGEAMRTDPRYIDLVKRLGLDE